ncbi:MAG: YlxR family protein [Mycobacteriales bacterium]
MHRRVERARPATPGDTMPCRTCVGCRARAAAPILLRLVQVGDQVVPDPGRCEPGRGAWLHPCPECLALAVRRRAFRRAFRVQIDLDSAAVLRYVGGEGGRTPGRPSGPVSAVDHDTEREKVDPDEPAMKRQR